MNALYHIYCICYVLFYFQSVIGIFEEILQVNK